MPTPAPPDHQIEAVAEAYQRLGSKRRVEQELGMSETAVQVRVKHAALRGLLGTKPVLPGFRISQTTSTPAGDFIQQKPDRGDVFELPPGHTVKGVSALVDEDGREIVKWIKTREEHTAIDIAETLKKAFENYEPAAEPAPAPKFSYDDLLTLIPCNDWHVGMFAWRRETGTDWDLRIAEQTIGQGAEDAIRRSPPAGIAIVLGGGDLTHADNNLNQTSRSANKLDVDGRHQKIVETAGRLMVRTIDAALRHNSRVIVRNLKGNHDEETASAIAWFLFAWYRNEPRVTVDLDQSLFFYHRFGKVMLAATHGHEAKLADMPMIMAHRRAEDWGETKFRYAHGFHVHHRSKSMTEGEGVIMESHQAPIPQDSWHFGSGFLSGRSIQTIQYHRWLGEIGRVRVAILDAAANDNTTTEARVAA